MGRRATRLVDDEDKPPPEGSLRRCVATRAERPPSELIRFVAGPGGVLVPDLDQRLPGRGAWVTGSKDCLREAIRIKAFGRALKRTIAVPGDLVEAVDTLLLKRTLSALSLAKKAGLVTTGFEQVHAQIERGDVAVLLHGTEAARDGRDKLDRKFAAVTHGKEQHPVMSGLTITQLSLAMGGANVVHAALIHGGATERFLFAAQRLARFRSGPETP